MVSTSPAWAAERGRYTSRGQMVRRKTAISLNPARQSEGIADKANKHPRDWRTIQPTCRWPWSLRRCVGRFAIGLIDQTDTSSRGHPRPRRSNRI